MKKIKFILCILFVIFLASTASSCGLVSEGDRFGSYSLQVTYLKDRYELNESVIVKIIETAGSPQGYNVYKKLDESAFEIWKQTTAKEPFTLNLTEFGTYTIKVVAVVDNVERLTQAVAVDFFVSDPIPVENILIKNNIIDLYFGESGIDSFALKDLEVVYFPANATQKGLGYRNAYLGDNNFEISEESIARAKGYSAGQAPYIIPISSDDNGNAVANVYFRINSGHSKFAFSNFQVGYINKTDGDNGWEDKVYLQGDWVNFQCIEYANMQKADGYDVAKKVGEEYIALGEDELQTVNEQGITFYKVLMPEATGFLEYRFRARVDGASSQYYKDVTVEVAAPPTKASAMTLGAEEITLLTEQTYTIVHTIAPEDAVIKSVTYEIAEGGESFIEVDEDGVVTPLAVTTAPVVVTVRSVGNTEVSAEIEISVLDLERADIITHSKPLTQSIESAESIVFGINSQLENFESVKWYKNGALQSQQTQYSYAFAFPETAGTNTVEAKVTLTENAPIILEYPVTLQSCFTIGEIASRYELNSEITLGYETELEDTTISWQLCSPGGVLLNNISAVYTFNGAGEYRIKGILSYNGGPVEQKLSALITVTESVSHELFNISVNGYYDGENYAPKIRWQKLKEDVTYTVEIRKGTQEAVVYESEASPQLFSSEGFEVPYADFKLSDSFDYRIMTSISNRYTGFRSYGNGNTIHSAQYTYLDNIGSTSFNRYINSVYELGKVLNYIKVFRPQDLFNGTYYIVDLYFGISFDAQQEAIYGEITTEQTEPAYVEPSKLISAANRAYGEGTAMSMAFSNGSEGNGGIRIQFNLEPAPEIIQETAYNDENDIAIYTPRYSDSEVDSDRPENNEPSLDNARTLSVTTSTQLYLAAQWGYRPLPVSGSVAKEIYDAARDILNEIITVDMSDAEKALAIYDYLTLNVAYDSALYNNYMQRLSEAADQEAINVINNEMGGHKSFHLEGSILNKVAVCDGISKAYVLLCSIEDITALKLSGTGDNDSGDSEGPVNHAWNAIMLDGAWYYVDATWGRWRSGYGESTLIASNHYYFLATDSEMQDSHDYDGEVPVAAAELSYYYFYNDDEPTIDLYFESEAEFDTYILQLPSEDDICVEFVIAYGDYEGELESYVENKLPTNSNVYIKGYIVLYIVMRG